MYISPNGTDDYDCCGSLNHPCGTLGKASKRIFEAPFNESNESILMIHVSGVNYSEIINNVEKCSFGIIDYTSLHKSQIIIEFDTEYIQTRNDWFPTINRNDTINNSSFDIVACESLTSQVNGTSFLGSLAAFSGVNQSLQVILRNVIWDWDYPNVEIVNSSSLPLVFGEYLNDFELIIQDSIFYNVTYTDYSNVFVFVQAFNFKLINCIFDNINIKWTDSIIETDGRWVGLFDHRIDSVNRFPPGTSIHFNFSNCIFTNIITNAQMFGIYLIGVDFDTYFNIDNSSFDDIWNENGMIRGETIFVLPLYVEMRNNSIDNVNGGYIINIDSQSSIIIDELSVSSSQLHGDSNDVALLSFGGSDYVELSNIEYTWILDYDRLDEFIQNLEVDIHNDEGLVTVCAFYNYIVDAGGDDEFFELYLNSDNIFESLCIFDWPVAFIHNSGVCNIRNLVTYSTINDSLILDWMKDYMIDKFNYSADYAVQELFGYSLNSSDIYFNFDFVYDLGVVESDSRIAVIYNSEGGDLTVTNMICHHSTNQYCISNEGTGYIENFETDYAAGGSESLELYDPSHLQYYGVMVGGGNTIIINSKIHGFGTHGLLTTAGSLEIWDSEFIRGGRPIYYVHFVSNPQAANLPDSSIKLYNVIMDECSIYWEKLYTISLYTLSIESGGNEIVATTFEMLRSLVIYYYCTR